MAKMNRLEKLPYAELEELRNRIDRIMLERHNSTRDEVRRTIIALLSHYDLSVRDLFGRRPPNPVAVKYRDPKNSENTWTGRGRMAGWLVAATECGKAKPEDFLI